jgi:hypothetical protein
MGPGKEEYIVVGNNAKTQTLQVDNKKKILTKKNLLFFL